MRRQLGTPSVSWIDCHMKQSTDPVYIGIDLGDRHHHMCVTNEEGRLTGRDPDFNMNSDFGQ